MRIERAFAQSFAKSVLQEWLAESRSKSAQSTLAKRLSPKDLQQKWREEERSRQEIEFKRNSGGKQEMKQIAQEDEVHVQHETQSADPECQAKMLKLLLKGSTDEQVKHVSCVCLATGSVGFLARDSARARETHEHVRVSRSCGTFQWQPIG